MENKSHAFAAGLFTIGLTVAVLFAIAWFNFDRTVRVPYDLIARTNVTGLSADAAVRYRGLAVGKVGAIRFDRDHPGQIVIRINVDKRAPMTHSTYASLAFQGVTGLGFIQLDDSGADPRPLVSSLRNVARIPMRPGLLEQLQQRGDVLLRQMEKIAENLDAMTDNGTHEQLLATAKSLQGAANGIATLTRGLQPATDRLPGTIDNLNKTMSSVNALAFTLNSPNGPMLGNLDRAGRAAEQAGAAAAQLDLTVQEFSNRIGNDTLPRVGTMADDMRAAARSIDRAATTFDSSPRSVLFGAPAAPPGPGEPGFMWPAARSRAGN
jgi:phospholipid/cholesterol/gamma-HCH transport system substrate-binding protein